MGFYKCPYILRSKEVCNERCYQVEECKVHWKSPNQVFCIECEKLTSFIYSACRKHVGKYHI